MRSWLANLAYLTLLFIASPWLLYQSLTKGKYRDGLRSKFLGHVPLRGGDRRCVWIHAVSVGEVALAHVFVRRLKKERPQLEIVISTTSRTGYELAQTKFAADTVTYAPLDFSWSIRRAIDRIRPDLLLLVELEMWPNLIWEAERRSLPVGIINGRLSEASYCGYRRIRPVVSSLLRSCRFIGAANEAYAKRFVDLGARDERVTTTGSIKYDGAEFDRDNLQTRELASLAGFAGRLNDYTFFVAGSTQEPEELLALQVFQSLSEKFPSLRLLIVPRHPERFEEVAKQLEASGVPWRRRSQLSANASGVGCERVLLVDSVGELAGWWGLADIAFVGGSMGSRGGQNMIEPAAYGAAVCFGPNTRNFKEVTRLLLAADAARVVTGEDESGSEQDSLASFVAQCLEQPDWAVSLGQRARSVVVEHRGALDRTMELVALILDSPAGMSANKTNLRGPHQRVKRRSTVT